jgi:hypothetical protein
MGLFSYRRRMVMKNVLGVLGLTFVFGLGEVCAQTAGSTNQHVGVDVQLKAAIAQAQNPTPAANASKKTTTGKGKASAKTANTEKDDDSFWIESIDLEGDGTAEETDLLYDDEDKVLLLYDDGDFKCKGGVWAKAACSLP